MGIVNLARQRDRANQQDCAGGDEVPIKLEVFGELVGWNNRDSWSPTSSLSGYRGYVRRFQQVGHPGKPERFTIRAHSIDSFVCPCLDFGVRYHSHQERVDRHARVVTTSCHDRRSQIHRLFFIIARIPRIRMKKNVADERGRRRALAHRGSDGVPPLLKNTAIERANLIPVTPPRL